MDTSGEFPIHEVFESAVSIVKNLPKEGPIKPSDELKLKLYAYFKQATHGPNNTPKPRFYQIVEAYKWNAWRKLGNMCKEEAMENYIRELKQIMETIPKSETQLEESKHFEDILGKKFYDYWFDQWKQSRKLVQLDTQTDEGPTILISDGYWTPTRSTSDETITVDISNQFTDAVLRLQQYLRNLE